MEVLYRRCCGLDVHKETVVACLKVRGNKELRQFGTTTEQLRGLAAWLNGARCTHVAMESTGVYWKPIYNVLESTGMTVDVVNARHVKIVPGRKTDVKDAEWICDLYRHGLVRGSFIPDRTQRELRELVRYRRSLIQERTREVNRIQKVLEGANIKLASVVEDVMGASGRAMLNAMAAGETDPEAIAALAHPRLQASPEEIREAVQGFIGGHQRLLIGTQLKHIDLLNLKIAHMDAEIEGKLRPVEPVIARLGTIPGVGRITAQELIAAIGTDMSRFPTAAHLASWAKVCPGANESAGKQRSTRTGKGSPFLRATLTQAAKAVAGSKDSYLRDQYYRLRARRGPSRATIAVAHTILVIAYHVIKDGTEYKELGPDHLRKKNSEAAVRQLVRQLQRLGKKVTVEPAV